MVDSARPSVCFLAGTLGQGGAERQLYYVVNSLLKLQIPVRVLTLTHGEYWETQISALGIPVTTVGQASTPFARLLRIMALMRRYHPKVFQSHHFYANLYVAITGRVLGIRDIGAIRGNLTNEMTDVGLFGNLCLRLPRQLAVNSYSALQLAESMGVPKGRLSFFPNVVDCDRFYPEQQKKPPEQVRILTVSRLVPVKRIELFLGLLARLKRSRRQRPNIIGIIVGDGPERRVLEKRAYSLGLTPDDVEFSGKVTTVEDVYRKADIFLLTSSWEGTPNVVLEAMACGLPVVTSRVGDTNHVIAHGITGYFIDPMDEEATLPILTNLVYDPKLRNTIGSNAREHVLRHHSLDRLPFFLEKFYRALL